MCTNVENKKNLERPNKPSKILKGMAWKILNHIITVIRTYLDLLIDFVFGLYWDPKRQSLPNLSSHHRILQESAVSLATKIRNKELKSEDLVRACIERIKIVNPLLNAVTDERFEDALNDARDVDKLIENGVPDDYFKKKPFLGVPFTSKESHAVAGMLHTLGISQRRYTRAVEDAECVRLLRETGAIPVAVTNVPEINKWQETRNMVFGTTNNPYHTGRTTGGSSGGEAALAASFASPISLCSDVGGSTRMPAFYCGLFGYNPSAGYTSLKGSVLRSGLAPTMASISFVSRHCGDLAPLTSVVAGRQADQLALYTPVDVQNLKYFYMESAPDLRVSPIQQDLKETMEKVLRRLGEESNSELRPLSHRGFGYMYSLWRHWMTLEDDFATMLNNNKGPLNPYIELVKKLLGLSPYTLAAIMKLIDDKVLPKVDKRWAETTTQQMVDDLTSTLGSNGVLIMPSAPLAAPHHYSLYLRPFNFSYWAVVNVLKFPSVQVPLGVNKEGVPLGVQVVAARRQDALCLAVAKHLANMFGGYTPPCQVE